MSKFLDYTGLSYFLDKLKGFFVTLSTDQNITGTKTFVGQKKIQFKQSASNDKLGFTLYNNNGVEKGYLEYNPANTIDGHPLMTLGNYASTTSGLTHVGFRKFSNISGSAGAYNLLAPLVASARTPFNLTTTYQTFYLPLGITDGTTIVKTSATGLLNIQSLIPNASSIVSSYVTSGGYVTSSYVTSASVKNADSLGGSAATFYAKKSDVPTSSNISSIASSVVTSGGYAVDTSVVHTTGDENISGLKTFSGKISTLKGINAANNYNDIVAINGGLASVRSDGNLAETRVRAFSSGANTSTDTPVRDISFRAQLNGNAGIWDNTHSKWAYLTDSNGDTVFSGTATNANKLGTVAASNYALKTDIPTIPIIPTVPNIKYGSSIIISSGTSVTSGGTLSSTITFGGTAFSTAPTVILTVVGGAGSLAQQHSACVYSISTSDCAIRIKNTGRASSTTAHCYVHWLAITS